MTTRPARPIGPPLAAARRSPPTGTWRRLVVGLLAAGLAGCGAPDAEQLPEVSAGPPAPLAPPPHVLLIVLDTVRADRLSVYGHARPTSPHLEALAARGTRFDHAVAAAPWTVPSHASMFTGLPPAAHGAHHEHRALSPEARTLAEHLAEAGYRTAGVSANPFVGPPARLDQGFESFDNVGSGRAVTDAALAHLAEDDARPLFLMLNYMDAHLPFSGVPDEALLRFGGGGTEPVKVLAFEEQFNAFAYACHRKEPEPERMAGLEAMYDAALAHLDGLVAEVLAAVPEPAETLVIVVADHGELQGERGLIEHQFSLHEALLRVPLIVSWPGHLPEGEVFAETVGTARIFDWVVALARPDREPRRVPWRTAGSEPVTAEYYRPLRLLERVERRFPGCAARLDRRLTATYAGPHKLVLDSGSGPTLYDVAADPAEEQELGASQPELRDRLAERARAHQAAGVARLEGGEPVPEVDPATRQRLEALGYAGT